MFVSFVLGYLHEWTKIIPIGLPHAIVNAEMKQDVVNRMFNGSGCRRGQEIIAVVPILGIILEAKKEDQDHAWENPERTLGNSLCCN